MVITNDKLTAFLELARITKKEAMNVELGQLNQLSMFSLLSNSP